MPHHTTRSAEGTHGTPACNYGRRCGTLRAHGEDVMISAIATIGRITTSSVPTGKRSDIVPEEFSSLATVATY